MKTKGSFITATVGTLVVGFAAPAPAASGGTNVTITITGGTLGITAQAATAGNLSRRVAKLGREYGQRCARPGAGHRRTRSSGSGWVASAVSTAFTPPSGPAVAASAVSYTQEPS